MAIYKEDIIDIDLNTGTLHRSFLNRSIGKADIMANRFGVRLFRGTEPVNLGGASCEGFFMAPNGQNIALTDSDITGTEGNVAWVQLPQACYNYEGQFTLAIKVIDDSVTATMRIVDGVVNNTGTDSSITPPPDAPTWAEVIAAYEEMLEAKEGSVRYDIEQELTTEEKAQARSNIGMVLVEFIQIGESNFYTMDVSTECEFVSLGNDNYGLVFHAD